MSRPGAIGVAASLAALLLAGCGGSAARSTSATTHATTTTRTSTTTRPHLHARRVQGPPLGARQTVHTHGADLTVTVLSVEPLTHTGSPALPGTRQFGVTLRIANQAGETYDSTSSGDVSLVLSSGQAQPLDVRSGACTTPLVDFESMIESGDVRSGCVGFSVPRAARVLGVRFSPHARPFGVLTWRVR